MQEKTKNLKSTQACVKNEVFFRPVSPHSFPPGEGEEKGRREHIYAAAQSRKPSVRSSPSQKSHTKSVSTEARAAHTPDIAEKIET